jgi:PIN domain nuclease of toxin-antitoxin system
MSMYVVDTHTIVWYLESNPKLSDRARNLLDQTSDDGYLIHISAISIVEICYLLERDRIPSTILQTILQNLQLPRPTLTIVSMDIEVARSISEINRATVPDMPDRIIAATAPYLKLPLITCDHKIQACNAIETIW